MSATPTVLVRYGGRGVRGASVINGSGAPGNGVGNDGDFYIDTAADVIYGPRANGAWPTPGTFLKGNTVWNGSGAPSDGLGRDGDFYLDTAADVIYGPKAGGAWPEPGAFLRGNTVLSGSGAPDNGLGRDGDYYVDETLLVLYGPKAAGAWPTPGISMIPAPQIKTFSANHVAVLADGGSTLRFNASGAGAGGLVCTVNRNLGALVSAGVYSTHRFKIMRDPADASSNPIIIQNDLGAEIGRIINPVIAGAPLPWLEAEADGTTVTCTGVP